MILSISKYVSTYVPLCPQAEKKEGLVGGSVADSDEVVREVVYAEV